jgi:hypothetical protein
MTCCTVSVYLAQPGPLQCYNIYSNFISLLLCCSCSLNHTKGFKSNIDSVYFQPEPYLSKIMAQDPTPDPMNARVSIHAAAAAAQLPLTLLAALCLLCGSAPTVVWLSICCLWFSGQRALCCCSHLLHQWQDTADNYACSPASCSDTQGSGRLPAETSMCSAQRAAADTVASARSQQHALRQGCYVSSMDLDVVKLTGQKCCCMCRIGCRCGRT